MKILCPVDFSKVSKNSIRWVAQFLNKIKNEHTIHILNCIETRHKLSSMVEHEDVEIEMAKTNINALINEIRSLAGDHIKIEWHIVRDNAKATIISKARRLDVDLVVLGTKGLSNIKELTIGSVTDFCIQHGDKPVLAIPENVIYKEVKEITIAVDDQILWNPEILNLVLNWSEYIPFNISLAHVKMPDDQMLEYDPAFDLKLLNTKYNYSALSFDGSISETIANFANENHSDILCVIHKKRHWLSKLFHKSVSKSELFILNRPLLILQEQVN